MLTTLSDFYFSHDIHLRPEQLHVKRQFTRENRGGFRKQKGNKDEGGGAEEEGTEEWCGLLAFGQIKNATDSTAITCFAL
jgi:hypothetical protein